MTADSFEIPLLSVQPLVENAVKHGVGFDTSEVKNDGRYHVGMKNTKRRLKDMCGADVVITSVIGERTTAKIIIPKIRRKRNEDTLC